MQATSKPDWEVIKLLYMQGLTPKRIAEETGVKADHVSVRANRGKWKEQLAQAKAITVGSVQSVPLQTAKSLVEESKLLRENVSDELHSQVAVLRSKPCKNLADVQGGKGRKGRAETLKVLVDAADKVYGWSGESGGNVKLVQVNILAQVSTAAMDKE